jgi:anaerobic selenocysteine-containing dehydrogenase
VIDELLRRSGAGVSFEALAQQGTIWPLAQTRIQFAQRRFPTPSGKIELACPRAAADGHPLTAEPHADPRPPAGALRLLSPASRWTMNDSFANEPKIGRRLRPAWVALHALDAAERGLREGERVRLRNGVGALELTLRISDAVPRGVALSPKGRWPKLEETGANVNVLNPGTSADMGASTSVHGIEVTVEPAGRSR